MRTKTLNFRHPITTIIPRSGQLIRLIDGRTGWVAGHSVVANKFTFVCREEGRTYDMFPVEFKGFKEIT